MEVTPSSIHINVDGYMDIKRTFWGVDSGTVSLMVNTEETRNPEAMKARNQLHSLSLHDMEAKGQVLEQGKTLKATKYDEW